MIFVIGPLFAGKENYICSALGWDKETFCARAVRDVQDLAAAESDLVSLAERLAEYDVVLATEIGGGVVPVEAEQRHAREQAGRLSCLLAERADCVVHVCCGLGQVLKGELHDR